MDLCPNGVGGLAAWKWREIGTSTNIMETAMTGKTKATLLALGILAALPLLLMVFAISLALSGCAPIYQSDAAWRQDDSYGTGQRGERPDGGAGTRAERITPRAPTTPN
jgi:hypothetical protein